MTGGERHAILHEDGIYNLFTIANGIVVRIDDYADRHQAFVAAGLATG